MNLTVLEKIGGLYHSKALGHDISEPKKSVIQEIESHITKLNGDIQTNQKLSANDKRHLGSLAENSFLLDEYKRYLNTVNTL